MADGLIRYLFLSLLATTAFADTLKAQYSAAKLPITVVNSQLAYDGNDSIYIFGTGSDEAISIVARFSIDSDSCEEVGRLPSVVYLGSAQAVGTGIYYFGGQYPGEGYRDIIKFDTLTNTVASVGKMPFDASYHTTFKQPNSSNLYFFKSSNFNEEFSKLYELDMSTYAFTELNGDVDILGYTSAVVDKYSYIFGQEESTQKSRILMIDMESINSPFQPFTFSDRVFSHTSQVVSDGISAYIINSHDPSAEPGYLPNAFVRINLQDYIPDYPEIENFPMPTSEGRYFFAPSAVYVDKLNRIYYFGGRTWNSTSNEYSYVKDIWYIDLSTK